MPLIINQGDNLPAVAVTDAMIAAGQNAFVSANRKDGQLTPQSVVNIYLAMNAARTPDTETLSTRDRELVERFDAGLLNDFGGGNVGWWWEYIRSLLDRADEHYREQAADRLEALLSTRDDAPDARPDVDAMREALEAADQRLCQLSEHEDEETRVVVMQIRDAVASSLPLRGEK